MEDDQQFCLRWNNHQSTLISVFDTLLENGTLVDCTLAAEGRFLKAHKVVLSACSPYFATLLSQQYDKHPIFILKDVKYQELKAMMDYMYRGEVNISQDQLAALLKAAESLQIKGLSDNRRGGGGGGNSGSGNSANQAGEDNTQRHVPVAQTTTQQQPPQQQQQPGYTIEQRRPLKHTTNDTEVIDSREGSASPTSKRRKRIRRRSIYENNVVLDNHELSNSSSQSMAHPVTSTPLATATSSQLNSATSGGATTSVAGVSSGASSAAVAAAVTTAVAVGATTSGGSPYVMNVTKKTDTNIIHDTNSEIDNAQDSDRDDDASNTTNTTMSQHHHQQPTHHPQQSQTHIRLKKQEMDLTNSKDKMDPHSELLIEPKSEYDDGNDEPVEDLTLDDEELLEDLDQAGPSHGGEGSSQGYAQWQVERSQDEVYMSSQDGSGQHRDAQDEKTNKENNKILENRKDSMPPSSKKVVFFDIKCNKCNRCNIDTLNLKHDCVAVTQPQQSSTPPTPAPLSISIIPLGSETKFSVKDTKKLQFILPKKNTETIPVKITKILSTPIQLLSDTTKECVKKNDGIDKNPNLVLGKSIVCTIGTTVTSTTKTPEIFLAPIQSLTKSNDFNGNNYKTENCTITTSSTVLTMPIVTTTAPSVTTSTTTTVSSSTVTTSITVLTTALTTGVISTLAITSTPQLLTTTTQSAITLTLAPIPIISSINSNLERGIGQSNNLNNKLICQSDIINLEKSKQSNQTITERKSISPQLQPPSIITTPVTIAQITTPISSIPLAISTTKLSTIIPSSSPISTIPTTTTATTTSTIPPSQIPSSNSSDLTSNKNIIPNIPTKSENQLICKICNKKFTYIGYLTKHLKKVHEQKLSFCDTLKLLKDFKK